MSKTIQINPSLFNVGGSLSKTKKVREKKQKPIISPLITPNSLKNKLLKRIKEHKKDELGMEDKTNSIADINIYTNEFNDSIEYLKNLSSYKKSQEANAKNQSAIQASVPIIELDLPDILKEEPVKRSATIHYSSPVPASAPSSVPASAPSSVPVANKGPDPPYGCLKGGQKPTFRSWNETQKNRHSEPVRQNLAFIDTEMQRETDREKRLAMLKEKIKMKQEEKSNDAIVMNKNLINFKPDAIPLPLAEETNIEIPQNELELEESSRRLLKKTIRRKYTIGKSKTQNKVGVLIKDRNTRKNVLNAQRDLRKKPINEVKLYLRDHALLKAGSNAPNDVIRKIYESSILAGEITNNNEETLLHNFLKEKDKEFE